MSESLSKIAKKINWKETVSLVAVALILFILLKMLTGGLLGTSLVVIENGPQSSMWPTYDKGDMFLVTKAKPQNIHMGDVIVYRSDYPTTRGMLIIHRVINITKLIHADGKIDYYYRVSGDNPISNLYVDPYNSSSTLIPYEAVIGKTVFLIPKIGYMRIWLSTFPIIQYLVIGVLIAVLIYFLITPEKKDEKNEEKNESNNEQKDEKTNKNKKELKETIKSAFKKLKTQFIQLFTDKKKRKKVIIYTAIIIALFLFFPILDTLIANRSVSTGINNVKIVNVESYTTEQIYFMSYKISFSHDGTWNKVLKAFNATLMQNNHSICYFYWYSFYQKEGELTLGGSFIIPMSEFNTTLPFTISVAYTVHLRFGHDSSYFYNKTFSGMI